MCIGNAYVYDSGRWDVAHASSRLRAIVSQLLSRSTAEADFVPLLVHNLSREAIAFQ